MYLIDYPPSDHCYYGYLSSDERSGRSSSSSKKPCQDSAQVVPQRPAPPAPRPALPFTLPPVFLACSKEATSTSAKTKAT
jgi:hypothetical protein